MWKLELECNEFEYDKKEKINEWSLNKYFKKQKKL
jgi:hypothetical protein